ncbi:tigger transposable element-derived protein 6-like protein [Plakobranchus ocellatus]|uniref:Tigger transposable element-derived protein 6-like protein n=1 Tax=Plakobranchus ocellatus TaxID=259542 RepID=A0AAV3ZCN0_9GAST|nr:tigger transposable element-derived protein 6-like protein [Plakobranchus ocellatus]
MRRHAEQLSLRTPQALGGQRAAVAPEDVKQWFKTAETDIIKIDTDVLKQPHRIFNCDESGFKLGGGITKVIAPKIDKRLYQMVITHNTMTVHDICKEHGIIFYSLPSHASHVVQPLDLTTFKKLKQSWREEVLNFQEKTSDTLSKKDFAKVFKKAWDRGVDRSVVSSGFRAAGIFPWNPDHVDLSKLGPSRLCGQTDRTHNPDRTDSSTATLSSSFLEELVDTDPIVATDCTTASTDDLTGGTFDIDQPSTSTALPDNDITLPSPRRSPDEQTVTHSRERCLNMLLDLTAKLGPDKLVTMRIMYNL